MNVISFKHHQKRVGIPEMIRNGNSFHVWIQTFSLGSRSVLLNDKLRFLLERVDTLDKANRSRFRAHDNRVCLTALCRELNTFHQFTVRDACRSKDTVIACNKIVHQEDFRWIFNAHLLAPLDFCLVCW